MKSPAVSIKTHPQYPETHVLVEVESRGRVYAISWARPWPTESEVLEAWAEDHQRTPKYRVFRPFDHTTGREL
jgi:hypothetical protein